MTSKSKDLLLDIGIIIVVFIIATIILGVTNYRNNQQGVELSYASFTINFEPANPELSDNVYLLQTAAEARDIFPGWPANINWNQQIVLGLIDGTQPTSGYDLEIVHARRQGPVATIRYRLVSPPADFNLTVLTQPALLVALNRDDLASSSQFIFRFQNIDSSQTTSLSVSPNEI